MWNRLSHSDLSQQWQVKSIRMRWNRSLKTHTPHTYPMWRLGTQQSPMCPKHLRKSGPFQHHPLLLILKFMMVNSTAITPHRDILQMTRSVNNWWLGWLLSPFFCIHWQGLYESSCMMPNNEALSIHVGGRMITIQTSVLSPEMVMNNIFTHLVRSFHIFHTANIDQH